MGARRIVWSAGNIEDTEYATSVCSVPSVPQSEIGIAPATVETELSSVPIPATKQWKTRVKKKNRKKIYLADEDTIE